MKLEGSYFLFSERKFSPSEGILENDCSVTAEPFL